MRRFASSIRAFAGGLFALALVGAAQAQNFDLIEYDQLVARLGSATPDGSTVKVGQVEALEGTNYGPNQAAFEFAGKTFTPLSGPPGFSIHANTVASFYYGNTLSVIPETNNVWLYEAGSWLQAAYLKAGFGAAVKPVSPPSGVRIFNNSWIANVAGFNQEILRRADYASKIQDVFMINGVGNGSSTPDVNPCMSHMFNGIAVGRADGNHVHGPTGNSVDGPGRMKPELVAPGTATSYAAPVVASVVGLLLDTAAKSPSLAADPESSKSVVIKSIVLSGATHRAGWTNNPDTTGPNRGVTTKPLDAVYGADLVNVDRSHMILTSLQQNGSTGVPATANIDFLGWDHITIGAATSIYYRLNLPATTPEVSVALTWHRTVNGNFSAYSMADFSLILWRVDSGGRLVSLVGDDGIPYFGEGNVVSESPVDNVEHLYLKNVAPGNYVLEVKRLDSLTSWTAGLSWFATPTEPELLGDINLDGAVDGADLGLLLATWGSSDRAADLNGDGVVDGSDLGLLLANW